MCVARYSDFSILNSDLPNTLIIYTLFVGMAYTHQARSRYIDVQTDITINGDMGVPFQARSRYFSRLAVLKLS